ncbi:hypothetical protein BSL78_24335 [Apostichopus japonicus]|uniref:Cytosolic fatty-acid binding proteins domain-containing protein n=1 Tax=Stichopus japonicus TaxID=307972 RepID=A0A2G8JST7_STIJA|nr:hypothetical protein BSL78_24335 [Apostichopus japonicus]
MADSSEKPDLTGHWVLERNDENFDKYLQAVGLNWFVRKIIAKANVSIDITTEGDKIEIRTHTPKGDLVDSFVPGDEYEMKNIMTGKMEKKTGYWDGDVLVVEPVDNENLPSTTRSLKEDCLLMTNTVKGVSTTRYFKKK